MECCAEFNCQLSVHEIQHPTAAKVQQVYEAWMLKLLDINLEDCIKAAKDQLDHMDHYVGPACSAPPPPSGDASLLRLLTRLTRLQEIHQEALYIGVFYHTLYALLYSLSALSGAHVCRRVSLHLSPFLRPAHSSQLLALAQIHDFTVSDLTAPTYQRFYYILSGLLNFYDFEAEQRALTLLPLIEENAELMEREDGLMREIQSKRDMIEQEK